MTDSPFLAVPPAQWIASNAHAFAVWDRFPASPGHALIVPKRLVASWWHATLDEQHALLELADVVRRHIERVHQPDGWNIGLNIGEAGGQTVPHLHLHVIPRYAGDVVDPRGGIRHAVVGKGNWLAEPSTNELAGEPAATYTAMPVRLFDGVERALGPELNRLLLDEAHDRLDVAVAFVTTRGVARLHDSLADALDRGLEVRFLTSDYLDVTEPVALSRLMALFEGRQAELRIVETRGRRGFHAKAYLFSAADGSPSACLVGSSNLTAAALEHNVEWNVEVDRLSAFRARFDDLWDGGTPGDARWIAGYAARRTPTAPSGIRPVEVIEEEPVPPPQPTSVQQEALAALAQTREAGHASGLVVMATGLGKTWLAAFDSRDTERLLFIAHREEILRQAREVFAQVRPDRASSMAVGGEVDLSGDAIFASVQWLHRNLERIPPDFFADVIVDEFHHAAARSYRRVLAHLRPGRFLLGLTATPERLDGADLLALTGDNLVYDCGLVEGIDRDLLAPFRYRGIADEHVDYQRIRWRRGRFDEEALNEAVGVEERIEQIWWEWQSHGQGPTLGFCVSIAHADAMANAFARRGVRAVAVHTGPTSAARRRAIADLATGDVGIVFAVDLFNEGLDVPRLETVLLLRPTESPVVFLQQLGRGLRRAEGKEHLRVLDFLGNHRTFLDRLRLLLAALGDGSEPATEAALKTLEDGTAPLPKGCELEVDLAAINLLAQLQTRRSALEDFVRERTEQHGVRPTAAQCHAAGLNPAAAKPAWFHWLADRDLLDDDDERAAVRTTGALLRALQSEQIVKSFKLLVLRAMLRDRRLWEGAEITELAEDLRRQLLDNPRLHAETAESSSADPATASAEVWLAYVLKNPIAAWAGEMRSDPSTAPFELSDGRLQLRHRVPEDQRETVEDLIGELVDWRLLRYLEGRRTDRSTGQRQTIINVIQNANGQPILMPLDREAHPWLPQGEAEVDADGRTLVLRFVKVAVNVARDPADAATSNALPDLLRDWFGPDAGRRATRHQVLLTDDDGLRLRPLTPTAT